MTDSLALAHPSCCGEPMVHNTFMDRWECADAYFRLFDAGWDGGDPRDPENLEVLVPVKADILEMVTADELRANGAGSLVPYLEHWRGAFRSDDSEPVHADS